MALRHGLFVSGASAGVTAPQDARLAIASLLSGPGVSNGGVVTGSTSGPNMKYTIAAGAFVTQRGTLAADGLYIVPNDGPVTADSGSPAPSSGTRWDLVWVRQPNAFGSDGFGDANSDPVFGVTVGTAGSTPTKPYASVPAGALVLAESNVGTSIANASLATISNVAAAVTSALPAPVFDTGWLNITSLQTGWTAGVGGNIPQVRQIGNRVYLQGNISDSLFTTSSFLLVANIPAGIALPTGTRLFPIAGPVARQARLVAGASTIEFTAASASTITYGLDSISYMTN